MKTKHILLRTCALSAGLLLLGQWCGEAQQVLFFDNFAQFANGTDLSSTGYAPASGPAFRFCHHLGSKWVAHDHGD